MTRFSVSLAVVALTLTPLIVRAGDDAPDPELERQSFKVTDGFEVNLWASDPLMAKPIQMNWDAQGRLWVASSSQYPQIKPGEAPADKVLVLEDTDHDGKADKSTVFADGLLIPTGVAPGDGGAYVANSTEVLHLKDTNGDGKADQRRVVLSGFGTEDTHHIIHTFRWGVDGRLYMNQSIYIHSHVETPHGVRRLMGSGLWRFRPESADFDVVSRGMVNPWGTAFDDWGTCFQTDGAGGEGIYYAFNGSAFQSAVGYERVLSGMNPGSPKYCGLELVGGRHLPDDWQGNAITNDFRANRVVRFQIIDENGVYVSKQLPDVITSTDVAFRPIDVKMGPDGAIYIADWYNPIINHGEVDFRDPRRDKTRGRIWRLTAKGRPLVKPPTLVGAPVADVLEQLKSPEPWTREQAKLVLRSMGEKDVIPTLKTWVSKLDANDAKYERNRLEALWTYQSLDVAEATLLNELLNSKLPQARAAAAHVVADWADRLPNAMELLAARTADDNPRVRIEAVRGLARLNTPRAIEMAMTALDKPKDPNLDYALWTTARETESTWMPAFKSGQLTFSDNPQHAGFALQAVKSPEAAVVLAKQLAAGKTPAAERASVFDLIATVGGPDQVKALYDVATAEGTEAGVRTSALAAIDKSIRQRNVAPAGADVAKFTSLLESSDENLRIAAMKLAGAWKAIDTSAALTTIAEAPDTKPAVRQAAISALADRGEQSADAFRKLDASDRPFDVRAMALVGLAALDLNDAAARAATLIVSAPEKSDPSSLIGGLLSRQGGGAALDQEFAKQKLTPGIAKVALKAVETSGRDEQALLERLRRAAGVKVEARKSLSPEEMARKIADVKRSGDAARGEATFRSASMGCFKCHAINGAGSPLAPDLGSIGASSPVDYLIDSLLEPNKAVKDGYQAVIVTTKDNDVHSGIKVSQDDKQMILRDAVQDRIVIPLGKVKNERPGASLMPTGLTDPLPSWDFLNLVRFLSELGKPGPYANNPAPMVRRWRMLPAKAAERLVADPTPLASPEQSAKLPWAAAYSLVSGEFPPDAMAEEGQQVAFVRAEIDVTTPGEVGLHIAETRGLSMWIDETPLDVKPDVQIQLATGVHRVTFRVDVGERGQGLRVEVRDVPGSGAHARPVGGR